MKVTACAMGAVGLALAACVTGRAPPPFPLQSLDPRDTLPRMQTSLDRAKGVFVMLAGPFRIAPAQQRAGQMAMDMPEDDSLVGLVTWPLAAWVRGFSLRITDAEGRPLQGTPLHHFNVVDFDRRELVYPLVQRLMSFGKETDAVTLPSTVGSPLRAGEHIGFYLMWDNETGEALQGIYLTLTVTFTPMRRSGLGRAVYPFFVDVKHDYPNYDTFDVPPGGCVKSGDFSFPISGHLLVAGGHLHDHGVSLRMEDPTTGKTLVTLNARRDTHGAVLGVSRRVLALLSPGPWFRANHIYRLVVAYDNPTADTLRSVMGIMAGLFAPDDPEAWPAVDPGSAEWQLDMSRLRLGR